MNNKLSGVLQALVCIALWALIPVVSKFGQLELDSHQFLFWSSLISLCILLAINIKTGHLKNLKNYSPELFLKVAGLGLLGTYIYYLFLYFGYANGRGMEVLIVQYTWPVFVSMLSCLLLKETFSWNKIISTILGFSAVLLILTKGDILNIKIQDPIPLLLVGLGAFCFALFSVLSKKIKQEPMSLTLIYFATATLISFLSMLLFSSFALPSLDSLLPLVINGIFVNGVSYVLWLLALGKVEASFLAPLIFLTPILSTIYLLLFFNEPFMDIYWLALGLTVAAGLVINLKSKKKNAGIKET